MFLNNLIVAAFLAQTETVSNSDLGKWIVAGAAVMVILNQGKAFLDGLRESPPIAQTYATQKSFDKLEQSISDLTKEVRGINTGQALARKPIHRKLNKHDIALHVLASRLSDKGERDGKRMQDILSSDEAEDTDE
ncbi:MAG: hypothetical protein ABIT76_08695 [Chthoniobacterales bacterium]